MVSVQAFKRIAFVDTRRLDTQMKESIYKMLQIHKTVFLEWRCGQFTDRNGQNWSTADLVFRKLRNTAFIFVYWEIFGLLGTALEYYQNIFSLESKHKEMIQIL